MPASSEPRQDASGLERVAVEREVVLPKHLHARPAGLLAQAVARRPETLVELVAGERRANARSILTVLALGAVAGTAVRVIVTGGAAAEVAQAAAEVVEILQAPEPD
jgi:phosphocarrier protein HPr